MIAITSWLFSSSIVVEDGAAIRDVLTDVYSALELDWRPETAGAANDLVPDVTVNDIAQALAEQYAEYVDLSEGSWPDLGVS